MNTKSEPEGEQYGGVNKGEKSQLGKRGYQQKDSAVGVSC